MTKPMCKDPMPNFTAITITALLSACPSERDKRGVALLVPSKIVRGKNNTSAGASVKPLWAHGPQCSPFQWAVQLSGRV